jgi:hypothetical protein
MKFPNARKLRKHFPLYVVGGSFTYFYPSHGLQEIAWLIASPPLTASRLKKSNSKSPTFSSDKFNGTLQRPYHFYQFCATYLVLLRSITFLRLRVCRHVKAESPGHVRSTLHLVRAVNQVFIQFELLASVQHQHQHESSTRTFFVKIWSDCRQLLSIVIASPAY